MNIIRNRMREANWIRLHISVVMKMGCAAGEECGRSRKDVRVQKLASGGGTRQEERENWYDFYRLESTSIYRTLLINSEWDDINGYGKWIRSSDYERMDFAGRDIPHIAAIQFHSTFIYRVTDGRLYRFRSLICAWIRSVTPAKYPGYAVIIQCARRLICATKRMNWDLINVYSRKCT